MIIDMHLFTLFSCVVYITLMIKPLSMQYAKVIIDSITSHFKLIKLPFYVNMKNDLKHTLQKLSNH